VTTWGRLEVAGLTLERVAEEVASSLGGLALEAGTPLNAEIIQWNSGANEWQFAAPGAPAAHDLEGASHTLAGAAAGQVLRATGATTFAMQSLIAGDIPSLDASKITTGTFADARIPNLAASKITSGIFATARIPSLDAGKITTGTFATARIPNLATSKITSGTFANARISQASVTQHQAALSIAATQLTGTIADARITGIYTGIERISFVKSAVDARIGVETDVIAGAGTEVVFRGLDAGAPSFLYFYTLDGTQGAVKCLSVENLGSNPDVRGEIVVWGKDATNVGVLRPNGDAMADLGIAAQRWRSLYVGKGTSPTVVAIEADGQIVSNRVNKGVSGSGTVTFNWNDGNYQRIDATGDFLFAFSNGIAGASYLIEYEADGTLRNPDETTNLNWGDGAVPTWPTINGDKLFVVVVYDGTTYHAMSNGIIF